MTPVCVHCLLLCSDVKVENVLLALSPHASPSERRKLAKGVGAMRGWSVTAVVSDFGGCCQNGLARPAGRGYGTIQHRAPELLSGRELVNYNMTLADMYSTGTTYCQLR